MNDNKVMMNLPVVKAMTKKGFVFSLIGLIIGLAILIPSLILIKHIKLMYFIVLLTCGFFASSLSLMMLLTYRKLYHQAKTSVNSVVSNFIDEGLDFSFYTGEKCSQSAILKYGYIQKVKKAGNYLLIISKAVTIPINYDEEVIAFLQKKMIKIK